MESFKKKTSFLGAFTMKFSLHRSDTCANPQDIFIVFSGVSYYVIPLCEVITLLNWMVALVIRKWFTHSPRGRHNFLDTLRT